MAQGKLDILPFYCKGELSDDDAAFLQTIPGYGATNRRDEKHRYGFNAGFDYESQDFLIPGQWLGAEDGNLDRTGWFQPSYVIYENPGMKNIPVETAWITMSF